MRRISVKHQHQHQQRTPSNWLHVPNRSQIHLQSFRLRCLNESRGPPWVWHAVLHIVLPRVEWGVLSLAVVCPGAGFTLKVNRPPWLQKETKQISRLWFALKRSKKDVFIKKLKNVSCEYDRVNSWNSTLQAAWYIRHVRIIWFMWTKRTIWLLILNFTQNIVRAYSMFYPYEGYK